MENDATYFDKKWTDVIKQLPTGGMYGFDKRQFGYDIIKGLIQPESYVFDFACGLGLIDTQLEREKGCITFGCDFSPVAIDFVRRSVKMPDNFQVTDKFFGYDYDAVIAVYFLEHIKWARAFVEESLKVGKSLIVALPNDFNHHGEHIDMQWASWDEFAKLFDGIKWSRKDKGLYPINLHPGYKHPIVEFTR